MKILMFIYHLAWTFVAIVFLPFIPFIRNQRLLERAFPIFPGRPARAGSIWIHALSVGEVLSAVPLVGAIKKRYPRKDIVFTVATTHGIEIAFNELEGEVSFFMTMPVDFWWSVKKMINYINPSIFILVETDLWPGLITRLRGMGIPTILLNGRVSPRSYRSYKRFKRLIRFMFNSFEVCLMQSDLDRKRLLRLGLTQEKVKTAGNIKFDREWVPLSEREYAHWLRVLNLGTEDKVWIAGSTHQGEEDIVLDVFKKLLLFDPTLRLIIAPRDVTRAKDIFSLSMGKGFKTSLRTELGMNRERYDVLILNTLGELDRIYGLGKISFVGGSLVPVGGHNLLEPASFGQPVLFGPHTQNFVLMSQLLLEAGGGKRVKDGDDLFKAVKGLLSHLDETKRMGTRAKEFVQMNRGALRSVMEYVGRYIEN